MIITDNNYQTMVEDSILKLKKEQNRILMFGIISVGLAAIIFAGAVVILVILLLRKEFKVRVRSYTINSQYHLYDKIFRRRLTTSRRVEEDKAPKVPVYENIKLQDVSEWSQCEKIDTSRCPAYDLEAFDSITTD